MSFWRPWPWFASIYTVWPLSYDHQHVTEKRHRHDSATRDSSKQKRLPQDSGTLSWLSLNDLIYSKILHLSAVNDGIFRGLDIDYIVVLAPTDVRISPVFIACVHDPICQNVTQGSDGHEDSTEEQESAQ